jgi:hypothetical protein
LPTVVVHGLLAGLSQVVVSNGTLVTQLATARPGATTSAIANARELRLARKLARLPLLDLIE